MRISRRRVGAIFRKELREYRRNGNIVYAMMIFPLIFLVQPIIQIFTVPASAATAIHREHSLVYMLAIPALVPATLAAYSIVGERLQGSLEPLLTTPVKREELVLGKALSAFVPSVIVAYLVFGLYIAILEIFAVRPLVHAIVQTPDLIAQLVFTPLLAAWSIWVGIAISARSKDPRTAAQLATLAILPTIAVTSLIAFNVIPVKPFVVLAFAVGLLLLDRIGWRVATSLFDREQLITSTR